MKFVAQKVWRLWPPRDRLPKNSRAIQLEAGCVREVELQHGSTATSREEGRVIYMSRQEEPGWTVNLPRRGRNGFPLIPLFLRLPGPLQREVTRVA